MKIWKHSRFDLLSFFSVAVLLCHDFDHINATRTEEELQHLFQTVPKSPLFWTDHLSNIETYNTDDYDMVEDFEGLPPLHYAAKYGRLKDVKDLIAEGTDANLNDGLELSPLQHTDSEDSEGWMNVVKVLIDERAVVNLKDRFGRSPLHYAAKYGWVEVVKVLIDEEATNVNLIDSDGRSPLHYAVIYGKVKVVNVLIDEKSTDVYLKDSDGNSPLYYAELMGQMDLVNLLIDKMNTEHAKKR